MTRTAPLLLGLLCVGCAANAPAGKPAVTFTIDSGFGDDASWARGHFEDTARVLVRMMNNPDVAPPSEIVVTLENDPDAQWLGGWAGPSAVGFVSDQWPKEKHRLWIMTHELVNLFAAHYAGHGGFPSDWWSNGRSPFPVYVACLVLRDLGYDDVAIWLRSTSAEKADHELYWVLHERYGFELFAKMLRLMHADDIDLGAIEPEWPHSSRTRSAYTIAYLSLAAGKDLTSTVLAFGVGQKPDDWDKIHPEIPFEEYTVTSEEVSGIQKAREAAFAKDAPETTRMLYRQGKCREVLEQAKDR